MTRKLLLPVFMLSFALTGCSSSTPPAPDNSAEVDELKAQVEELKQENEDLKEQLKAGEEAAESAEAVDEEASSEVIQLGEESTLGDWSITVTNAEFMDSVSNTYGSFTPKAINTMLLPALYRITEKQQIPFCPPIPWETMYLRSFFIRTPMNSAPQICSDTARSSMTRS